MKNKKVLDTIIITEQPTTCPKCGMRTETTDINSSGNNIEQCPKCDYLFETVQQEYIAYLEDRNGEWVDQTSIDENSMKLAKELFTEYGYDIDKYNIKVEPA